jgi:hypothetical protein
VIIGTLMCIGYFAAPERAVVSAPAAQVSAVDVETYVEELPRGEWTEGAFDAEAVELFRQLVHSEVLGELEEAVATAAGEAASRQVDLHTDAQLSEFNGRRLIFVFFSAPGLARGVNAIGVVGDSLMNVACVNEAGQSIELEHGACLERLQEAFPAPHL